MSEKATPVAGESPSTLSAVDSVAGESAAPQANMNRPRRANVNGRDSQNMNVGIKLKYL